MSPTEFVHLLPGPTGGLDVPLEAYALISDLISRDLTLRQEGESLRIAGPNGGKPDLSATDVDGIKRYKAHLLAMLAYRAPEHVNADPAL